MHSEIDDKSTKRPLVLWADDGLREKLTQLAKRDDRSLSNFCVRALRAVVERESTQQ